MDVSSANEDLPDEELPGQDRPATGRRTRITLAAAALVGVTVAVVLATRADPPRREARPPTPTSPTVPVTSPPPPPCLDVGGSALNCGVSPSLPAGTLLALQTALPGGSVVVASTVVARSGRIYSRRATVRGPDGTTLQVGIGPVTGRHSVITVPSSVAPTLITYDVDVARHHVTLTLRAGPTGRAPAIGVLRRLAQDPRLIAR